MILDSSISAVVTGGASGLGEATARMFASEGVRVAIFDLDADRGERLARELGGVFCRVDITSEQEVAAGFDRARAANGQERILVNCAGFGPPAKTVARDRASGEIRRHSLEMFERVMQINLIGAFRCIVHSAAGMLTLDPLPDGDRGVIVNTASGAAKDGQAGQAAYAASKAGMLGMTMPIARDLAPEAIRINSILPGLFDTPPVQAMPDALREGLVRQLQFPKRPGLPSEFAEAVRTLVTCGYFNGAEVRLDAAVRLTPR